MAANPTVTIGFQDGNLSVQINLAEDVVLKLGTATGGPFLTPTRATSLNAVLRYKHGPLVRSGAHHQQYSGPEYLMRLRASTAGSIGSVTKTPGTGVLASLGALTLSLASYTLHAQAAAGTLNLTTGWTAPDAPLPMTITMGGGAGTFTMTVTGVDTAGNTVSEAVAVTGAGAYTTTTHWASIASVTSSGATGGTADFTATHLSPGDRYNALLTCVTGGVLGVSGGTTPVYNVSFDGGLTTSRNFTMPSAGGFDLYTYAGGLTPQTTGIRCATSAGTLVQTRYGGIKIAGADTDGDVVYNPLVSGVTVSHVIAGMGTALAIGVVGTAITVTCATDGGGAVTSTGAAIATFFNTSGSAGAVAARLLVSSATAMGTGASLTAAAGATGNTTGGVDFTARVEGVTVRIINEGASKTLATTVVGKAVTISVTTNSKGLQTTTATQLVADVVSGTSTGAVAARALLLAEVDSGGGGIVGCYNDFTSLPVSVATGDKFAFTTTPPHWTTADLQEGLNALLANPTWLGYASAVHVLGDTTDAADVILDAFVQSAAAQKKQFKLVVAEATYMGSTAEVTWMNTVVAAYATTSLYYGIAAGEANALNPAYGTIDRMNVATPYLARLMICPISELPSHVDCETIRGIKRELDGVPVRPGDGDQPLWQSEDTLATLNTENFITLRTHPGRSGVYVRQGLDYTVDGSDFTYVTNRRVANVAAALAYDETLRFLNANLLLDPKTGQLAENECQKLESQVGGRLRKKLVSNDLGRQHCSAVAFTVDRGSNYAQTGEVSGVVTIVPRIPAVLFSVSIGFSPTLAGSP